MTDTANKDKKEDKAVQNSAQASATGATKRSPAWAWIAVALALGAWVALMVTNGYVALGIGIVAAVVGIIAATRNEQALRRLAVTAIIASTVLVVVLAAFLIVIKIGLAAA